MVLGLLAGLLTCALWGLTFVAPRAVHPFDGVDLAVARYTLFGLMSAALMVHPRFRPRGMRPSVRIAGLLLGGIGYVGYFLAIAFAVDASGAVIAPLIVGTMPVWLAILGNIKEPTVSTSRLIVPLSIVVLGLVLANVGSMTSAEAGGGKDFAAGVGASFVALFIWVAYGAVNSAIMRGETPPDSIRFTGLQGIGAAAGSLCLLPLTSLSTHFSFSTPESLRFAFWATVMGVAGSWLATWAWIVAARRLPLALSAQLIVAETVFGLAYGFVFERRWPDVWEAAGGLMQVAGVLLSIRMFYGSRAPKHREAAEETAVSIQPS